MPKVTTQYLEIHQTRSAPPTEYENLLGDALEKCFAEGIHDISALTDRLNAICIPAPGGRAWTPEVFAQEMQRLGA